MLVVYSTKKRVATISFVYKRKIYLENFLFYSFYFFWLFRVQTKHLFNKYSFLTTKNPPLFSPILFYLRKLKWIKKRLQTQGIECIIVLNNLITAKFIRINPFNCPFFPTLCAACVSCLYFPFNIVFYCDGSAKFFFIYNLKQ